MPNPAGPKRITEIWAWIVTESDGGEGIPAMHLPNGGVAPMLGADEVRVRAYEQDARLMAAALKVPVKLCRFSDMEVIETLN